MRAVAPWTSAWSIRREKYWGKEMRLRDLRRVSRMARGES